MIHSLGSNNLFIIELPSSENIHTGIRADESHYEVVKNEAYGIVQKETLLAQ